MEYQEIANIWNSSDEKMEESIQIRQELLKEVSLGKIKSKLSEIKWSSYFEIITNIIWLCFLATFIKNHMAEYHFLLPALLLFIMAALSIYIEVRKLILFYSLNSDNSVIQTQSQLEKLRYFEHLDTLSLYVIIPLFAAPFLIVSAQAFIGLNLYEYSSLLISLSAGSIIIGLIIVFILKKFPNKGLRDSILFLKDLEDKE